MGSRNHSTKRTRERPGSPANRTWTYSGITRALFLGSNKSEISDQQINQSLEQAKDEGRNTYPYTTLPDIPPCFQWSRPTQEGRIYRKSSTEFTLSSRAIDV